LGSGRRRPPWSQLQSTHPLTPSQRRGDRSPGR